jgi:hypothetical protein
VTDDNQPTGQPATTRDWVRAAVFIAVIVVLVILLFMLGIGQLTGCGAAYGC